MQLFTLHFIIVISVSLKEEMITRLEEKNNFRLVIQSAIIVFHQIAMSFRMAILMSQLADCI